MLTRAGHRHQREHRDVDQRDGDRAESGAAAPCFIMDAHVTVHGTGAVTTPSFHTAAAGETLLAFVSSDGPAGAGKQTATITGAGLDLDAGQTRERAIGRQRGLEGDCAQRVVERDREVDPRQERLQPIAQRDRDEGTNGVGASVTGPERPARRA